MIGSHFLWPLQIIINCWFKGQPQPWKPNTTKFTEHWLFCGLVRIWIYILCWSVFIFILANLESPVKSVLVRNYLDHVGLWACLWGTVLISWCGKSQTFMGSTISLARDTEQYQKAESELRGTEQVRMCALLSSGNMMWWSTWASALTSQFSSVIWRCKANNLFLSKVAWC